MVLQGLSSMTGEEVLSIICGKLTNIYCLHPSNMVLQGLSSMTGEEVLSIICGKQTNIYCSHPSNMVLQGLNSMTGEEVLSLHSKLSVEEQQLFEGGRISTVCFDGWLQVGGSCKRVEPSRKLVELEISLIILNEKRVVQKLSKLNDKLIIATHRGRQHQLKTECVLF